MFLDTIGVCVLIILIFLIVELRYKRKIEARDREIHSRIRESFSAVDKELHGHMTPTQARVIYDNPEIWEDVT